MSGSRGDAARLSLICRYRAAGINFPVSPRAALTARSSASRLLIQVTIENGDSYHKIFQFFEGASLI
jgi:hypothetical protein